MKQLIINADDYGMSNKINHGIKDAWLSGNISSTSIMPTEDGFDDAIEMLKINNLNLPVGVHLSITGGIPLSKTSNSFISSENKFTIASFDLEKITKINPDELEFEFESQIQRVINCNINVSHIDNHMFFVYANPAAFERVIKLSNKYELPLRWPFGKNKHEILNLFKTSLNVSEEMITNIMKYYEHLKKGLLKQTTDYYFQLPYQASFDDKKNILKKIIINLPLGTSELCIHPGYGDTNREDELKLIMSDEIKNLISQYNVQIINRSAIK